MNSLNLRLDFGSSEPIYVQIVDQVRAQLSTGELKPGDQLPTVRQLASELRVNFNTIARAYRLLDEAGQISTQRGRGTYLLEYNEEMTDGMVKKETIEEQLEKAIQSLLRQGYNREEIRNSLNEILK